MLCALEQRDGKWYCTNCNGRPLKGDYKRQCKANGQAPTPSHVDAAAWFTARYAKLEITSPPLADILAKLEQCRSAECDKLQYDVCTMQGVSACKQRSYWFAMLAGGAVCENWQVSPPPGKMGRESGG